MGSKKVVKAAKVAIGKEVPLVQKEPLISVGVPYYCNGSSSDGDEDGDG